MPFVRVDALGTNPERHEPAAWSFDEGVARCAHSPAPADAPAPRGTASARREG